MKQAPKKVTRNEQVNLVDLFYYLLNNWIWFVLCIALSVSVAYYRYSRTTFQYRSSITAILKQPGIDTRSARLDTYDNMINTVSLTNEELQLRSLTLMSEVVRALDADVNYTELIKFRTVELYGKHSPVQVRFSREHDEPGLFDIVVTPLEGEVLRIDMGAAGMQAVALGDTLNISGGKLVFAGTPSYDQFIDHEIRVRKVPVQSAAGYFISRLKISNNKQLITLTMDDVSAERPADILNTLVVKYNEDAIREKNRVAVQTADFIMERLQIIEQELGGVEGTLARFKSSNKLMSVDEAASMYLSDSRSYNAELVALETRISLTGYLRDYVSQSGENFQMIPAIIGIDDKGIESLVAQYNEQILHREKLVAASSTGSPAVRQVEASLATLRHNILGLVDNLQKSLDISRRDLMAREEAALREFSSMPSKEQQLLEIGRQQSIKEELYIFLLNKREENALSQAMADGNIRVIDPAGFSYTPVAPDRMKIFFLAFVIGLLVPAVILIARLFLDTKIRTRKEIEENINVPFLAEIPLNKELRHFLWKNKHHRKGTKEPSPFVYESSSHSVFTEAMRMMCTNLVFLDPDSVLPMVVGTTSYSSNSGKSFIVANMAACLADAQKRVVIVDTDMRKRSLSGELGLKHKTPGLSNFLYDLDMQLDTVLHKEVKPGIDFVPAGSTPPNPGELLSRPRFDELIKLLRDRYDYILLDGVPVQMLSEPLIVNRVVDCNLFILRSGQLDRRILPQLDELNENRHLTNMVIVFNGPEVKRSRGYGFGTYGYGYGYGYGSSYNDYDEESKKKPFWKKILGK